MVKPYSDIDGRWAQGWGGLKPNGVHVNVQLARRGSQTAAAITTAWTNPGPGRTPVLASLGATQPEYVTVNPPTLILSKMPAMEGTMTETLAFGACAVGISQGVLDAVAEGAVQPDQDTVVLVSIWIDPNADSETKIRDACREATRFAVIEAACGRPEADRWALVENRESQTHPFYGGE